MANYCVLPIGRGDRFAHSRPARLAGRSLHFIPNLNMDPMPTIRVNASPRYLADESRPEARHYVFAYTITISNHGPLPARLLQRHWVITDAQGQV